VRGSWSRPETVLVVFLDNTALGPRN